MTTVSLPIISGHLSRADLVPGVAPLTTSSLQHAHWPTGSSFPHAHSPIPACSLEYHGRLFHTSGRTSIGTISFGITVFSITLARQPGGGCSDDSCGERVSPGRRNDGSPGADIVDPGPGG